MDSKEQTKSETESVSQEGVEINPYGVVNTSGKEIDYEKLIKFFGCQKISPELIARLSRETS